MGPHGSSFILSHVVCTAATAIPSSITSSFIIACVWANSWLMTKSSIQVKAQRVMKLPMSLEFMWKVANMLQIDADIDSDCRIVGAVVLPGRKEKRQRMNKTIKMLKVILGCIGNTPFIIGIIAHPCTITHKVAHQEMVKLKMRGLKIDLFLLLLPSNNLGILEVVEAALGRADGDHKGDHRGSGQRDHSEGDPGMSDSDHKADAPSKFCYCKVINRSDSSCCCSSCCWDLMSHWHSLHSNNEMGEKNPIPVSMETY